MTESEIPAMNRYATAALGLVTVTAVAVLATSSGQAASRPQSDTLSIENRTMPPVASPTTPVTVTTDAAVATTAATPAVGATTGAAHVSPTSTVLPSTERSQTPGQAPGQASERTYPPDTGDIPRPPDTGDIPRPSTPTTTAPTPPTIPPATTTTVTTTPVTPKCQQGVWREGSEPTVTSGCRYAYTTCRENLVCVTQIPATQLPSSIPCGNANVHYSACPFLYGEHPVWNAPTTTTSTTTTTTPPTTTTSPPLRNYQVTAHVDHDCVFAADNVPHTVKAGTTSWVSTAGQIIVDYDTRDWCLVIQVP